MAFGGAALRLGATALRILEFACAAIVLGIFSYFLAVLSKHNVYIPTWEKAVEGMSGAACVYTIFGIILTLCLGGVTFFGMIGVALDVLFAGCFAAIAYYTRHGANKCSGIVNTPIGRGPSNASAPGAGDFGYACSLNTAVFAVSILCIFLFLLSVAFNFMLVKHHQKEKRYGPSPTNNYTKGKGRKPFWRRNKKATKGTRDAEMATAPAAGRFSNDGTTLNGSHYGHTEPKYGQPGYGHTHPQAATNY